MLIRHNNNNNKDKDRTNLALLKAGDVFEYRRRLFVLLNRFDGAGLDPRYNDYRLAACLERGRVERFSLDKFVNRVAGAFVIDYNGEDNESNTRGL